MADVNHVIGHPGNVRTARPVCTGSTVTSYVVRPVYRILEMKYTASGTADIVKHYYNASRDITAQRAIMHVMITAKNTRLTDLYTAMFQQATAVMVVWTAGLESHAIKHAQTTVPVT